MISKVGSRSAATASCRAGTRTINLSSKPTIPSRTRRKGGLLLARYGKGFYVYDALALYRQLPAGVPGAFRLLANLVSLSKNPSWN